MNFQPLRESPFLWLFSEPSNKEFFNETTTAFKTASSGPMYENRGVHMLSLLGLCWIFVVFFHTWIQAATGLTDSFLKLSPGYSRKALEQHRTWFAVMLIFRCPCRWMSWEGIIWMCSLILFLCGGHSSHCVTKRDGARQSHPRWSSNRRRSCRAGLLRSPILF